MWWSGFLVALKMIHELRIVKSIQNEANCFIPLLSAKRNGINLKKQKARYVIGK